MTIPYRDLDINYIIISINIIISILVLIERKNINIVIYYVLLIISWAIILNSYGLTFYSLVLIIIYASALAILFAFIVMLYDKDNKEYSIKDIRDNFKQMISSQILNETTLINNTNYSNATKLFNGLSTISRNKYILALFLLIWLSAFFYINANNIIFNNDLINKYDFISYITIDQNLSNSILSYEQIANTLIDKESLINNNNNILENIFYEIYINRSLILILLILLILIAFIAIINIILRSSDK